MNKSIVPGYASGAASAAGIAAPTQQDLPQCLLTDKGVEGAPRRFALLVKNLKLSGGNRVILKLFDRLQQVPGAEIHVYIVPEVKRHIGQVWDLVLCKRRYRAAAMLGLAKRVKAKILQASTSEVYGDPVVHPQTEDYWGNVNPIGPRSCYDEGKRCAEALFFDYSGNIDCGSKWRAFSILMVRECTRTTAGSYQISSFRRFAIGISRSMAMGPKRDPSAMSTIWSTD